MQKFGLIHNINLNTSMLSLQENRKVVNYYIPKNIFKKLKKYLYAGNFVSFVCGDEIILKRKRYFYEINYFKEISVPSNARRIKLYSKRDNIMELKKILSSLSNMLFIDLEMTMPNFEGKNFKPELIQASYIITDKNLLELKKRDFHIIPTMASGLNERTEKFLHITTKELFSKGVKYRDFYNVFKMDLDEYKPTVVIFGKNDKGFLESSYKTNMVESLNGRIRFINISQLLKNYFELQMDPGLFKSYEILYNDDLPEQKHDSFEDAYYTYKIFAKFKEIIDNE